MTTPLPLVPARRRLRRLAPALIPLGLAGTALTLSARADAVPAFTAQTGQPCQACHVGGFGPQLTAFGRDFKLNGYTMRAQASVPLSAMAIASVTHTKADQNPAPANFGANDNPAFDQGSLFIAGGAGQHFGGFAQITYDGVAHQWHWDNLDMRLVTKGQVLEQDATFGLTLNNAPTVQDAWNTTAAWGFPYTASALAPAPGTAPLVNGGLAQEVLGLSAYAWVGQTFYLEAGGYRTPGSGTLNGLGVDPAGGPGDIHGIAPYVRATWQHDLAGGTFALGGLLFKAAINPGRDRTSGYTDHYTDLGMDASWLRPLPSGDTLAINARYVHESGNLQASCALALVGPGTGPDCAHYTLSDLRGDLTYSYRNKLGLTLGAFTTRGSANPNLYASPNAAPDSNGATAQVDYTPWGAGNSPFGPRVNLRLGIQYTAYGKFDGQRYNYDGAGAKAADNNTLRVFSWLAF